MDNLEQKADGSHSYVGVGEPAWHRLGKTVQGVMTAEEVSMLSNQNYTVVKKPVMFHLGGRIQKFPTRFVIAREDTHAPLGVCGKAWTPLQNSEAFKFFDAIVDRKEAIYHTGGVLGQGERAWILAKIPNIMRVGQNDVIEQYVLISNIFTGHEAVEIALTNVRVVCMNTLMAALAQAKGKMKISIPHTRDIVKQVEKAHEGLGLFSQYSKDLEAAFNRMSKVKITDKILREYLDVLLPKSSEDEEVLLTQSHKNRHKIEEFFEIGVGQDLVTARGTVFGLYQAVTGFTAHVKEYKDETTKFKNLMIGGASYKLNQRAFDLALELVNA